MGTREQRRALLLVALAAVLANASWFSATAVGPALEHDWHLTPAGAAWLVIMVQLGFVGYAGFGRHFPPTSKPEVFQR